MEFITKKTTDLSLVEKQMLVTLFNEVFEKERTIEEFDRQFLQNIEGFSYHTFAEKDGRIIAANTMVPSIYCYRDGTFRFVNSVDTMISKSYRGLENFYDMARASFNAVEKIGYDAVYGFPNDNSYQLFTQLKFMKDVGRLDTFCLPYRIGGVKNGLSLMNPFSMVFCWIWTGFCSLFATRKIASFLIKKDAGSYNQTRYQRGDGKYSFAVIGKTSFVYKILEYQKIRTAFIVDIYDKSQKNFTKAVRYLLRYESRNFDLILYVGSLPFGCTGMIKIPKRFEPKRFNFTAGIFNKKGIDKNDFFNIYNWDVNLSNYDLL